MTRPRRDKHAARAGAVAHSVEWPRFTVLAVLLALIPLRTLISETPTFEMPRLFRGADVPGGVQPGATFVIAAVILAAGAFVYQDALRRGRRIVATGAEFGAMILLAAAVVSTSLAGQKHLALIGVVDFLAMVVYMLALRQLLCERWMIQLALFVMVGTAACLIVKCAWQRGFEIPTTIEFFEAHRDELTRSDGDAGRNVGLEHDFEMRLRSGAVTGYYGHPNLLASHLILFLAASAALLFERWKRGQRGGSLVMPVAVLLGCAACLVGTQSKGAMAACGIAALAWVALRSLSRFAAARPRTAVFAGWLAACIVCTCVVAWLQIKPDALGRSILFRTMYWQGAVDMIADLGVLGIGANNFGRHFTRYKSVECPEEVESPHSWPVQFATEWGVLGLAGFLAIAIGVSLRVARQRTTVDATEPFDVAAEGDGDSQQRSIVLWIGGVFVVAFLPWFVLLGGSGAEFVAVNVGVAALPWFVAMLLTAIESRQARSISNAPLASATLVLAAGLIGFLVHTAIDLALFAGGPATTFFATAAIMLAARECRSSDTASEPVSDRAPLRLRAATIVTFLGAAAVVAILAGLARPAIMLASDLRIGRVASKPAPWESYELSPAFAAYQRAHRIYPLDATAGVEWLEQLMPRMRTAPNWQMASELAESLRRRDPHMSLIVSHQSELLRIRYEMTRDVADLRRAVDLYRACVEAYPTAPRRRIRLAMLMETLARETGDQAALARVADELQTALDLEKRRVYVSSPNRMPPEEAEQLRRRIAALRLESIDGRRAETISLLGRPLYANPVTSNLAALEVDLEAARAEWAKQPNDPDRIVWLGRRLAYLWRYGEAIDVFTAGLQAHPNDAALLRHRGHHYITLRRFNEAIRDLERAAALIADKPDSIEQDGMPNTRNIPLTTLGFNVHYHLALARYLNGDFEGALRGFETTLRYSRGYDDNLVAVTDWMYMCLRRLGRDAEAAALLEPIREDMEIIENTAYHRRCLMYKGLLRPDELLDAKSASPLDLATQGYGVGNWHLFNGDVRQAEEIFRRVVDGPYWSAFGHIAAEVELSRM